MNNDCQIYVNIYTKRSLSSDELVDAFRDANMLIEEQEDTHQRIARCVTISDDPFKTINSFKKTLNELEIVIGGQHKTLQELE